MNSQTIAIFLQFLCCSAFSSWLFQTGWLISFYYICGLEGKTKNNPFFYNKQRCHNNNTTGSNLRMPRKVSENKLYVFPPIDGISTNIYIYTKQILVYKSIFLYFWLYFYSVELYLDRNIYLSDENEIVFTYVLKLLIVKKT